MSFEINRLALQFYQIGSLYFAAHGFLKDGFITLPPTSSLNNCTLTLLLQITVPTT